MPSHRRCSPELTTSSHVERATAVTFAIKCLHAIRAGNVRWYSQVVACKDIVDVVWREGAKYILEVVEGLGNAVGIPAAMTVQHGDS